jgi:hypothetical protein
MNGSLIPSNISRRKGRKKGRKKGKEERKGRKDNFANISILGNFDEKKIYGCFLTHHFMLMESKKGSVSNRSNVKKKKKKRESF